MNSASAYLDELREAVNAALDPLFVDDQAPPLIREAMRYALLGGGKRLRPCLTLAAAETVARSRGEPIRPARDRALPMACAVELVHSYSLVHDDLPAMDNDTLRRGRPTSHVVYGDGLAILAGDGLLTEAFGLIAESPSRLQPPGTAVAPADVRLRAVHLLAAAAGAAGMVGGQTIDLAVAGRVPSHTRPPFDAEALRDMHARKTGALIRAAVAMGALAAGAEEKTIDAVDAFARELGLAFQIVDDVLDVEGSDEQLGKTPGKDAADRKVTYPSLYGVAQSRQLAAGCIDRAKQALAAASLTGHLAEIADWTLRRRT